MKTVFANTILKELFIHWTGNKYLKEGIILSDSPIPVSKDIKDLLIHYFIHPFREDEYMNLKSKCADDTDNLIYKIACSVFDNPESMGTNSELLAKHLYEQTMHPQIKSGEFYTVYFQNCNLNGEATDAIGLFKSESKETFLQIAHSENVFSIKSQTGIDVNKLDKGCIIFNKEREQGFIVAVTDNTNKRNEAKYWTDSFLHVKPRLDSNTQTRHILELCKEFVREELPENDSRDKMKQAILINRGMENLKGNDVVNMNRFAEEVFEQPQLVDKFQTFTQQYEQREGIQFNPSFEIDKQMIKRKGMGTMTTIRLDHNFVIQMLGGQDRIVKEFDEERKMFCYKLYFEEEK